MIVEEVWFKIWFHQILNQTSSTIMSLPQKHER
jgi:hypothetical protein